MDSIQRIDYGKVPTTVRLKVAKTAGDDGWMAAQKQFKNISLQLLHNFMKMNACLVVKIL